MDAVVAEADRSDLLRVFGEEGRTKTDALAESGIPGARQAAAWQSALDDGVIVKSGGAGR